MLTPWGWSDSKDVIADGIVFYGTPSHGGIKVNKAQNQLIPEYLRLNNGWYEEDCDWARVAVFYAQYFAKDFKQAKESLKNWNPEVYEKFFNEMVLPGESYRRDEDIFRHNTKNKMVTLAAAGAGKDRSMAIPGNPVPEGFVEVFAGRGGRLENGQYPSETAYYLVPEKEYDARDRQSFVINEQEHKRIKRVK